jgi:uncharacterized membrane protein
MEIWIIYALVAYLMWALVNIVDKFLLEKKFKDYLSYILLAGLFQIVVFIAIPFTGFSMPSFEMAAIGLVAGAMFFLSLVPYFKALSSEDATIVIPLGSLTPVLVLLISVVFLGEIFDYSKIASFMFLVFGGFVLAASDFNFRKIRFTPVLNYIILSIVMFAVATVLTKYTFSNMPVFEGFVLLRTGAVISSLAFLLHPEIRKNLFSTASSMGKKFGGIFIANETFALSNQFIYDLAISLGSISLISAGQGLQYVFLFLIAMALSFFAPKILKEDINRKTLVRKATGIGLIVFGLLLINL